MLCLGPGSACDVCLEAFGNDNKAPCSIECGHVFCANCLNHISRPSCPLCRVPFDLRSVVRLHVDVDNCGASQTAAHAEARRLQKAIADVANEGSTEPRLRQLISECKTFLQSQKRDMFEDLRVSHRMIAYLCEVKSKLRSQNQEVARLEAVNGNLNEAVERLDTEKNTEVARLEVERAESDRRIAEMEKLYMEERERARDAELEARRKMMETQERYIKELERCNTLRTELDSLKNEIIRLSAGAGFHQEPVRTVSPPHIAISAPHSPEENAQALKTFSPPEQDFMISPLPEFTTTTLPSDFVTLPTIEDEPENVPEEEEQLEGLCGAAGCPLSCNCRPVQLFTLSTDQTSAALELPSPGGPSLLSLTAPRGEDSPRSQSSYAPTTTPSDQSHVELPTRPPSPPSPPVSHRQVERLRDLLTDSNPSMTSSLPSPTGSHFQGRERAGSQASTPSRRALPSRSLESTTVSLSPQPLSLPSVQPASGVTPEKVTSEITAAISQPFQQRPGLSRASSAAHALEAAQRLSKERQKAEREQKRTEWPVDQPTDGLSERSSRPVSGVLDVPLDANYTSSKAHSSYYGGSSVDVIGSKGPQSYHSGGIDSQRSSYSNPSTLSSKMEGRSSRPKHESSYYNAGVDTEQSSYSNPSTLSSKMESRASRSNSRTQQGQDMYQAGMDADRSSYTNSSSLSSKVEGRATRSGSKTQQDAPARQYIPIQRETAASHSYQSVSASASSSYRDHDSVLYSNTPPTISHMSRPSSSSTASTQTKPSSQNSKDSSNSYRQYNSGGMKSKLGVSSMPSANVGYAHA